MSDLSGRLELDNETAVQARIDRMAHQIERLNRVLASVQDSMMRVSASGLDQQAAELASRAQAFQRRAQQLEQEKMRTQQAHSRASDLSLNSAIPFPSAFRYMQQYSSQAMTPGQMPPGAGELPKDVQSTVAKSVAATQANFASPTVHGPNSVIRNSTLTSEALGHLARTRGDPNYQNAADATQQSVTTSREQVRINRALVPEQRLRGVAIPAFQEGVQGFQAGDPHITYKQVQRLERQTLHAKRQAVQGASAINPELGQRVDGELTELVGEASAPMPGLARTEQARKASASVRASRERIEGYERSAESARKFKLPGAEAEAQKRIDRETRKLPGLLTAADMTSRKMPDGPEKAKLRRELMDDTHGFAAPRLKAAEDARLRSERGQDAAWAGKQVGKVQDKFDKMEDLRKLKKEFEAGGHDLEAEALRREIHHQALEARKQTDAMERLSKALLLSDDKRDQHKGFELQDRLHGAGGQADFFKGMADKVMGQNRPFEGVSLGTVLRRELQKVPLVGGVSESLGIGRALENAVKKSKLGQAGDAGLRGLSGGKLSPEEDLGGGLPSKAFNFGKAARGVAGKLAANPLSWIVGGGAVALNAARGAANANVTKTQGARNEEVLYGNLGNKLGTSDRIMNDVRETRGRDQNGALRKELLGLRMGTEDYVNFLSSANTPGLDADNRRSSGITGLKVARAYGLETGEVGGVAQQLALGDRQGQNGGNLNRDLSSFAVVLSEGIKRGVGSDETTRAFSGAIERARGAGGGVLESQQRQGVIDQLLSAAQSGNARLSGQNGADFLGRANQATTDASGKDMAFLLRSLGDSKGSALGLSKEDAGLYDRMRKDSPIVAAEFAQTKLTPEMQALQTKHTLNTYGGNTETLRTGLKDVYGMDKGMAATESQSLQEQLRAARKATGKADLNLGDAYAQGLVKSDPLDALSAKRLKPDAKTTKDALKETQADNTGYQVAGRQEIRIQDAKIQAERITFESESVRRNVEQNQNAGQSIRNTRQSIVGNSNRFAYGDTRLSPNTMPGYGQDANGQRTGEDTRRFDAVDAPERTESHASGGHIRGPGSDTSDSILARLSNGEFVVKAQESRRHRALLEQINSGKLPAFAQGGPVGTPSPLGDDRAAQRLTDALDKLGAILARQHTPFSVPGQVTPATSGPEQAIAQKSFLGTLWDNLKGQVSGVVSSTFGGGPVEGGRVNVPAGGAPAKDIGFQNVTGGIGSKLAATGEQGVSASWGEKIAGYCSKYVREATERALNLSDSKLSGKLFGATAIESGNLWKKRGLTMTPEQTKKSGGYQPGDTLFQMSGSGGAGHVGIVTADGRHVAENSTRGKGGKQITEISKFGRVDQVGRLSLDKDGDLRGDGIPQTAQRRVNQPPTPSRLSQPLGRAAQSAAAAASTVVHEVKVSGSILYDGKDDPQIKAAVKERLTQQIKQGGLSRQTPIGSARAG